MGREGADGRCWGAMGTQKGGGCGGGEKDRDGAGEGERPKAGMEDNDIGLLGF